MNIEHNVKLQPYTTMYVGGPAEFFVVVKNIEELIEALQFAQKRGHDPFILGGGSNMLVSDSGVKGLVVKVEFKGIELVKQDKQSVWLKVAAGERWNNVVKYAVDNGWWGIENLSHIPGNAGAIAVQNVGAYGQEASQVVESVGVASVSLRAPNASEGRSNLSINTGIALSDALLAMTNKECKFDYRSSIFNTTEKGAYVITSITLKLSKIPKPNLTYGDVKKYFADNQSPSLEQIRQAIIEIRDKKFPYPTEAVNGNSGSFFKAHTISEQEYSELIEKVSKNFSPEAGEKLVKMKDYLKVPQGVKVPYGYLIELCALKGKNFGNVAVCETHAGVLVNVSGKASAKEVLEAFKIVRKTVYEKTGILLQNEPELVGFSSQDLED